VDRDCKAWVQITSYYDNYEFGEKTPPSKLFKIQDDEILIESVTIIKKDLLQIKVQYIEITNSRPNIIKLNL
jgi:hypothetical protein